MRRFIVCVLAMNTIMDFVLIVLFSDQFSGIVVNYWLAEVPVVVIGAPLGASACQYFHRNVIFCLLMLIVLIDVVSAA